MKFFKVIFVLCLFASDTAYSSDSLLEFKLGANVTRLNTRLQVGDELKEQNHVAGLGLSADAGVGKYFAVRGELLAFSVINRIFDQAFEKTFESISGADEEEQQKAESSHTVTITGKSIAVYGRYPITNKLRINVGYKTLDWSARDKIPAALRISGQDKYERDSGQTAARSYFVEYGEGRVVWELGYDDYLEQEFRYMAYFGGSIKF